MAVCDGYVDMLSTNPDLSTLYTALQTAGLDATLAGEKAPLPCICAYQ